ncbi:MAG: leucine-rich repeat protein [Clostridia bacterium]|nr:leucine-rich repeat protein [Clostridia bacterium]
MSKTKSRLGIISLALIAVLVFTAIFNVALSGKMLVANGASNSVGSMAAGSDGKFVKVDKNFDSIREQYLNHELVQKNTASFDDERWVFVELEGDTLYDKFNSSHRYNDFAAYGNSVEGKKAKANIQAEQQSFLSKLDRHGINYTLKHSYSALTNAVAIKVNAEAYNAIRKMNGVVDVYYSESYAIPTVAVVNNANVYTTGIYDSSNVVDKNGKPYRGEGMVVAVLDTGLDYTHEAFAKLPENDLGWTKEYVQSVVATDKLNAVGTVDDFYYSDKVPFAYDYADDDADVYPSYSSHGTHVAGIVAGSSDYIVNKENGGDEKFIGVAPEAQLVIGKVFTDNLDRESIGGANTYDILAAIEDCTLLGVDVINMSLGTSAGFADEKSKTYINRIYEAVEEAGISLVVAASNDYSSGFGGGNGTNLASNPDSGTVGSPSTYSAALSVASINGQKADYITANGDEDQVAFITQSSNEYGVSFDFVDQLYKLAGKNKGEDVLFKYVVITGVGQDSDYNSTIKSRLADKKVTVNGKTVEADGTIALVKRGTNTFAEKVQAAMDAGADACIVYNNVSGTIRMSLGEVENPIPTCSITMDAGKVFVDNADRRTRVGYVTINSNQVAGPFMSDFSSWGPMPDLQLKPEITAHGGEITSAVAGGYDVYSGTSMAAPNMAGAVAILRQYLKNEYDLSGKELNARVNQVLMSTATIANNDSGNPYSPRKQGAGLAGIADAVKAEGYITVNDDNGEVRDKTKIELYDDRAKVGVYKFSFTMHNVTGIAQTYNPTVYVMTETMSSDEKTVAEKAYMLNNMSNIEYKVNGVAHTGMLTLPANGTAQVEVSITLGSEARKYLDANFKNGMYVEGFVSMVATGDTKVTLGLPYLAFYGDWTDAPLFDYDIYELAESDKNAEKESDKLKASAADTRVIGMYYEDKYILPLGQYLYNQKDEDVTIYAERDKIAISAFDDGTYGHTVYELYAVYGGLLRGAGEMDVEIVDASTGELIFKETKENINKSYAAGGSNRGAFIPFEIKPLEGGLLNNSTYNVKLTGRLDYAMPEGKTVERDTFEFPFTIDYETPEMLSYKIRFVPYTDPTTKVVKYKIYMDVVVKDNQYVQDVLPLYVDSNTNKKDRFRMITEYAVPVYGQKGESSIVSFEITDYYEDYVKKGVASQDSDDGLYIQIEDYAMNSVAYKIILGYPGMGANAKDYPDEVSFAEDENLVRDETPSKDAFGNSYYYYTLKLPPYTLYNLNVTTNPADTLIQTLNWSGANNFVKVKDNQIYAYNPKAEVTLTLGDEFGKVYARIRVSTSGSTGGTYPSATSITFNPAISGHGDIVSLDSVLPVLELNPGQTMQLTWSVSPWYSLPPNVTWKSSNENVVRVDQNGNITTLQRGTANVEVCSQENSRVKKSVRIIVGSEFRVSNYMLMDFYGSGEVVIPNNLNIMYLDDECFQNDTTITKVVLPTTLTEIPENAFKGCTKLEEVIIPGKCTTIQKNAFENCVNLKTVRLGQFVDSENNSIGDNYYGTLTVAGNVFKNCIKLDTITMYGGTYGEDSYKPIDSMRRLTTLHNGAFENCESLTFMDLTEVRIVGTGVFRGCTNLKTVATSAATAIGAYMFDGCTSLVGTDNGNLGEYFDFKGESVAQYAFNGCTALENVKFSGNLRTINMGAFKGTSIKTVTLPDGNITVDEKSFDKCAKLTTVELSQNTKLNIVNGTPYSGCTQFKEYALASGTSNYYSVVDGVLYSADKKTLVSVPFAHEEFELLSTVTAIGDAAYAGVSNIKVVDLSELESVGTYAFAESSVEKLTLPSGLTAIPEGLFYECRSLKEVSAGDGFEKVMLIDSYAFRGCKLLTAVSIPNALMVGISAFDNSGIKTLPSEKLVIVGAYAFAESKLTEVNLPDLEGIGAYAFAGIEDLKTVSLGAITVMADHVFYLSTGITNVKFAEGTTVIGPMAFYSGNALATAITVEIPNTVTEIQDGAFYNRTGLTTINLKGVELVYPYAFFGSGLKKADLSNIKEIGEAAFAQTQLESVELDNAEFIDYGAFYKTETLTSATFKVAKVIGELAFALTNLKTVRLPASLERIYEVPRDTEDEKGHPENIRDSLERAYGAGAFCSIVTLTKIEVDDKNTVYTSIDGVLYSYATNGLILEQYPANKEGESYTIVSGTVLIRDRAFQGAMNLETVELPYTVKTIGTAAFFDSNITNYIFNSVQAPTLLADYYDFNVGIAITDFYSNFLYYAAFVEYGDVEDFGLTATIPKNGKGYDGVWTYFFGTINKTENNMADDNTHKAIEAVAKLPSVDEIKAIKSLDQIKAKGGVGELAAAARTAYNLVAGADQLELAAESYSTLLAVEKALREKKEQLGEHVGLKSMVVIKAPTKSRYEDGETFDPTGMQMKVIYTDGSEVELGGDSRYTATPSVLKYDKLTYGSITVTITYTDGADKISTDIIVMVNQPEVDTPNPDPVHNEGNGDGLDKSAVIAIAVVIPVVVCLAVGAVVAVLLLKKKKKGGNNDDNDDNNGNDGNDGFGSYNDEVSNDTEFEGNNEFANEESESNGFSDSDEFASNDEPSNDERYEGDYNLVSDEESADEEKTEELSDEEFSDGATSDEE